ncbi:MAG TPA: hypothetical protein VNZ64_09615, partial [Candidatus Acidoferrum sp.]|nr:hypothetical protein [Candidatus Acidoferrum sp.]
ECFVVFDMHELMLWGSVVTHPRFSNLPLIESEHSERDDPVVGPGAIESVVGRIKGVHSVEQKSASLFQGGMII